VRLEEFGKDIGLVHEAIVTGRRVGAGRDFWATLAHNEAFFSQIVAMTKSDSAPVSPDLRIVRAIMGDRIFGPEDWAALYNARLPKRIPAFPWSEDMLKGPSPFHKGKTVAETHFAFLGLAKLNDKPLTIIKWRELHQTTGQPSFYSDNPWYRNEKFATDATCEFRWYLMPLEIVPNSERKTYQEQLRDCLPADYDVPTAIAEVTKDILAFRKTGTYPNPNRYGRVLNVSSSGNRVNVGYFSRFGLSVSGFLDDRRLDNLGLAAARKS